MRKYGKIYIEFNARPSMTDYEQGQRQWVDEVEAQGYIDAGEAIETSPGGDKPLDGTKKEIKKWLDDHNVDYDSDALKDELIEILKNA